MSNVPTSKIQQAISEVRAARNRVAQLAQGSSTAGTRIKDAQVRTEYLAKHPANSPDQKGDQQTGVNNRRSSSGPSGRDTIRRESGQMVSKLGGQMNVPKVSVHNRFNDITTMLRNTTHSHGYRLASEHPYDREPAAMPVAYGVKSGLLNPVSSDRLEAVMTQYGPGVKMRGKEFLTVVQSVSQTFDGGNSIVAFPLNPRLLQLPRLSIMSKLYTRFLFNKFNLHYHKSAGTQNNGSLQMFGVYDPTINPAARPGETLIAYAAQRGSTDLALYQDAVLTMDDSHFKDLLFLDPDDDLRWTMQGVVFVIAGGAIASGLEAGKIMLEYEITLCNDDLDQTADLSQRSYRDVLCTFAAQVAGNRATGTLSGGGAPPSGKYYVSLRTDPTISTPVWQNLDASNQADTTRQFKLEKGSGCYAVVVGSTIRFMYGPDLYSEDSSTSTFNKLYIYADTNASANTAQLDMFRFEGD